MYRNLSPDYLGLSCRQSELIELSLTHRFGGFDLSLHEFQADIAAKGADAASRLLKSARVKLNGGELPLELAAAEGKFTSELEMMKPLLEALQALGVSVVQAKVVAGHAERPFHENFEFHRQRLQQLGEFLAAYDLRVGLNGSPLASERAAFPQPFVSKPDELIMLLKMVSHERIGMVVDLWNWAVAGTSLDQFDNLTEAQITEVRLADPVGAITAEDATPDQRAMPAVDGPAGCVAALTKLAELGYRGAVTIAPHPSHNQGSREEIVRAVVETYDALLTAAGLDARGRLSAVSSDA